MDGSSGPGVGTEMILVQEAGVGIMIFGVGDVFIEGVTVVAAQAESRNASRKLKEKSFFMYFSRKQESRRTHLVDRFLKFLEGCYPRNRVDEI